jgi:hypothetical protein
VASPGNGPGTSRSIVYSSNEGANLGTSRRPLLSDVVVLPFGMGPTMREGEGGPVAREHFIHGEAVGYDGPAIAGQDLPPFNRGFAGQNPVEGSATGRPRPSPSPA